MVLTFIGLLRRIVMHEIEDKVVTTADPLNIIQQRRGVNSELEHWKNSMRDLSELWFPNEPPKPPAQLMEHMYGRCFYFAVFACFFWSS